MATLTVSLGERSYPILIGEGLLPRLGEHLREKGRNLSRGTFLVSNPTVFSLYGPVAEGALQAQEFSVTPCLVEDSEKAKSLDWAARLYDAAIEAGLDRRSPIIALGGGVVGDLAGFVAATYMRGVPFIQVPTTLLAQVDASVGGKVAVDHPRGKNLIGAFYQPQMVVIDVNTLQSLPARQVRAGLAEVVKYGVIWDADFLDFVETNAARLLNGELFLMQQVVHRSCAIKAQVVSQDERESGPRAILNFGHTVGHAIETLTGYSSYHHGEAVAMGMAAEGRIARALGLWSGEEQSRLEKLLIALQLPVSLPPSFAAKEALAVMVRDKKATEQRLTLVLPKHFGEVTVYRDLPAETVLQVLEAR
ncbi:MAG: 3-dehydroquinate synthase [Clostridia bacterium]|nr:MAG: 3-dehydroquinate synthase [Clostridia bacterium]